MEALMVYWAVKTFFLIKAENSNSVRIRGSVWLPLPSCVYLWPPSGRSPVSSTALLNSHPLATIRKAVFKTSAVFYSPPVCQLTRGGFHCYLFSCSCSVLTLISLCLQFLRDITALLPCSSITWSPWQDSPHLSATHSLELKLLLPACPPACHLFCIMRKTRLEQESLTHLSNAHSAALLRASQPPPASLQNQYSSLLPALTPHSHNLT